jgi:hypothetical protein
MSDEHIACDRCGRLRSADPPAVAITWVTDRRDARPVWICPDCARRHVREIEGKLSPDYW